MARAQQQQNLDLEAEEMQEKEFMEAFSELATLCGFTDQSQKCTGSGTAIESAPSNTHLGFKISASDPPPARFPRRTKAQ